MNKNNWIKILGLLLICLLATSCSGKTSSKVSSDEPNNENQASTSPEGTNRGQNPIRSQQQQEYWDNVRKETNAREQRRILDQYGPNSSFNTFNDALSKTDPNK